MSSRITNDQSSLTIVNKGSLLTIVKKGSSLTIVNKTMNIKKTYFFRTILFKNDCIIDAKKCKKSFIAHLNVHTIYSMYVEYSMYYKNQRCSVSITEKQTSIQCDPTLPRTAGNRFPWCSWKPDIELKWLLFNVLHSACKRNT